MHICLVSFEALSILLPGYEYHRTGGEQVQVSLLAKALARRGWRVTVVVFDYGQPDEVIYEGIRVVKIYAPRDGLPVVRFFFPRVFKLWKALKKVDADVYYTSCAGYQVGILSFFCRCYNKRSVFRIANDKDCSPNQLGINLWRDRQLYSYGLKNQDCILCQSIQQRQALKRNFNVDSVIAGMLVEAPGNILPFISRDIDILWVNNFRYHKRPDLALQLAQLLPEVNIHIIGGPNDAMLYQEIKEKALCINNIVFHGPVPYRDMDKFYSRAKVLVNTSDVEGFPNSYLQSWIRGTPVVTFFDPDDIIATNGLGFKAADISDMVDLLVSLLDDYDLWDNLSKKCIDYVAINFSEENVLKPYLNVLSI